MDSKHWNANSNHSKGIRSIRMQIRTIRKGFEAFEPNSEHSNANSNPSNEIQNFRIPFEWFEFAFECFESISNG